MMFEGDSVCDEKANIRKEMIFTYFKVLYRHSVEDLAKTVKHVSVDSP
jgi:hypothetical protein